MTTFPYDTCEWQRLLHHVRAVIAESKMLEIAAERRYLD
jgi:hypothetical protein